jgi:hypothetical protein
MIRYVLLFCAVIILAGCGMTAQAPVVTTIKAENPVIYKVPKDMYRKVIATGFTYDRSADSLSGAHAVYSPYDKLFHGVTFSDNIRYHRAWGTSIDDISGIKYSISEDILKVAKLNGEKFSKGPMRYSQAGYQVKVSNNEDQGSYVVTLTPIERYEQVGKDPLFMSYRMPNMELSELYKAIKTFNFAVNIDLNSKYNTESVEANFKRMLHQSYNNSSEFKATVDNCELSVIPKFSPYQNGTKVTGIGDIQCVAEENNIDIASYRKKIDQLLLSVVNN